MKQKSTKPQKQKDTTPKSICQKKFFFTNGLMKNTFRPAEKLFDNLSRVYVFANCQ